MSCPACSMDILTIRSLTAQDLMAGIFHDCGAGPDPADYPARTGPTKKFSQDPSLITSIPRAVEYGLVVAPTDEGDAQVIPVTHPTERVYSPEIRAVRLSSGDLQVSMRPVTSVTLNEARAAGLQHDFAGAVVTSELIIEGRVASLPRAGLNQLWFLIQHLLSSKHVPQAEVASFLRAAHAMVASGAIRFSLVEQLAGGVDSGGPSSVTPVLRLVRAEHGWEASYRAQYGAFLLAPDFEPGADAWEAGGEWAASVARDRSAETRAIDQLKRLLGEPRSRGRWPVQGDNVDRLFSVVIPQLGDGWVVDVPQRDHFDPPEARRRRSGASISPPAFRSTGVFRHGDRPFDEQAEHDYLTYRRDPRTQISLAGGGVPTQLVKAVKHDIVDIERPAAELERLSAQRPLWMLVSDYFKLVDAVRARDRLRARAALQRQMERISSVDQVDLRPVDDALERVHALLHENDAALRPHQTNALHKLIVRAYAGLNTTLAHPMGEGKTLTGLMFASVLSSIGLASGPILWVAPPSGLQTFKAEHERFCSYLRVREYAGRGRHLCGLKRGQIVFCTFDVASRDADALATAGFSAMVVDEFSNAKSPSSARHKALSKIRQRLNHVLLLNGTPIENSLGDLGAHLELLAPRAFWTPGWWTSITQAIDDGDEELRRLAKQTFDAYVIDIESCGGASAPPPPALEADLPPVQPSAQHVRIIDQLLMNASRRARETQSSEHMLGELVRIRQACNDASTVRHLITKCDDAPKVDLAASIVFEAQARGGRTLVFSRFLQPLEGLEQRLEQRGIACDWFTGATPADRRDAVVRAWADARKPPQSAALLMTLGAGARGLNLQGADNVIVMEPDWNPAVIEQAIKRAHRTGQRRTVTVYRLLLDHVVEHRILERSTQKIRLRDAIGAGAVGIEAPTDFRAFVQELGGFVQRSNAASWATTMNELDRRRALDTARGALREALETAMTASHEDRSDKVTALLAPGSAVMEALSAVESVPATAQELEGLQSTYDCLFKMTKIAVD